MGISVSIPGATSAVVVPELSEDDLQTARFRLLAGRILARDTAPYFSSILYAMEPVVRLGFGTFAVDKQWRMYYDPVKVLEWTVDEVAACWLHEAGHLWRDHGVRFDAMGDNPAYAQAWNVSGDGVINSDLKDMGVTLPDPEKRYYAEKNELFPQWRKGMTTEELYRVARNTISPPPQPETSGSEESNDDSSNDSSSESSDSSESNSSENSDSNPSDSSSTTENKDSENKDDKSDSSSSSSNDSSDELDDDPFGDSDNNSDTDSDNDSDSDDPFGDDTENQEGTSSSSESEELEDEEPVNSGSEERDSDSESSSQEGNEKDKKDDAAKKELPHSDCGSGACGGKPREYEEEYDPDGIDEGTADQIRTETAREIMDYSERYGKVPGSLVRDAAEILDPTVDWLKEINAVVRRICANVAGKKDYSYSRPSTRRGNNKLIFPSLRSPKPPSIVIVLDTSGSMSKEDLARCLTEIKDIIRRVSANMKYDVKVINCDASAADVKTISSIDHFEIIGNGGTDMRVGITAASEIKPTPDLIITMTDGGTPWLKDIPVAAPRAKYVVMLVKNSRSTKKGFSKSDTIRIPEWMHVIPVE